MVITDKVCLYLGQTVVITDKVCLYLGVDRGDYR